MAPTRAMRPEELSDPPFADFFWIAGLDGEELLEAYKSETSLIEGLHDSYDSRGSRRSAPIHEGRVAEPTVDTPSQSPTSSRREKSDSWHRLSKLSDDARRSIQSIDGLTNLSSNRSSATIRATIPPPGVRASTALSDADFNKALSKFADNRDTFFLDLNFRDERTGGSPQSRPRPKTQRIVAEDFDIIPSRSFGSVRRHMSFRETNGSRRHISNSRRVSARASKRMSSYNAVIPQPQHIQSSPHEHPLTRTFEPVLLDRYPRLDMTKELKRRDPFPDYIPMFAFPNDIRIISSDSRPPSTWHEFAMTGGDNQKIPAVCVTVWLPMNRQTADELEKLCERWRQANMTDAEMEMAASLAERLAIERAKLSQLLAKLPHVASESTAREHLEDDISAVEEKINLMSDMLRPLRHGAASRIEGLTDGDTGLWLPRAYGLVGKDSSLTPVWKEWLKAIVVPMMDGAILRVPASSPRLGMWQPLERYVFNICCEAQRPMSSKMQIELTVRELRLYAKKEAVNELPGSRSTDLYPLFRAMTIPNIVVLFEYLLAEARIILVSAHASMLHLVSKALLQLLWPLEWAGVFIPVLPGRLIQVLEAPCPYICGVVRKGEFISLPEDDFVMVDLDKNEIHATEHPPAIPKQYRRKLMSLLYLAAPHHTSRGVPVGPPLYAIQTFPGSMFTSENGQLLTPAIVPTNLVKLASLSSTMFGSQAAAEQIKRKPGLNSFLQASAGTKSLDRPTTANTARQPSQPDSDQSSPMTANFPPMPQTPVSRSDSGFALQTSLRDKRLGHLDAWSKQSDSFSSIRRKASLPFMKHSASPSTISLSPMNGPGSTYAPSSYAQSTLAASTIMPGMTFQPALNTETTLWMEGHCLQRQSGDTRTTCSVCDEKMESSYYRCTGCPLLTHGACAVQIPIVCQSAFYPDQVRAAFARFFTSLFYTYRKYIAPVDAAQRKMGMACRINMDLWFRSLPQDHATYLEMLRQTQAFNEFIAEREQVSASASDSVMLFDALIMAKRGRSGRVRSGIGAFGLGRHRPFGSKSPSGTSLDFMDDTTSHVWRVVTTSISSERPDLSDAVAKGREYRDIIRRAPAKLEEGLFRTTGVKMKMDMPSKKDKATLLRKMNGLSMNAP